MVILVLVFGGYTFVFGPRHSNRADDKARLRVMCDPYRKVPIALEDHFRKHHRYPTSIVDLDPLLAGSADAIRTMSRYEGFVYSSDGESYTLYKKLNWDGGIDFSSSRPEWCYGENDEPSFPIDR